MAIKILTRLKAPLHILVDISSVCQLACKYCSAMPFNGRFINTDRVLKMAEEISDLQVPCVTFSGGEPLMHPQIDQIIQAFTERKINLTVNSNGLLLNSSRLIQKLRSSAGKFQFSISLDAASKDINDAVRGSFSKVVAGIKKGLENGHEILLNSVVTALNGPYLHQVIEEFYPEILNYGFFRCYPTNRTFETGNNLPITVEEYNHHIAELLQYSKRYPQADIFTQYRIKKADLKESFADKESFCLCPYTKMYISVDLNVYPCYLTKSCNYALGNLEKTTLNELWKGSHRDRMQWAEESPHPCQTGFFTNSIATRYKPERQRND
jgi:radical SAM protein with 4Fe4S-binding SPASM domain